MAIENPAAFPCKKIINTPSDPLATPREVSFDGMSLRDYFAGQALSGLLASAMEASNARFALASYNFADAMLAERAKAGQL